MIELKLRLKVSFLAPLWAAFMLGSAGADEVGDAVAAALYEGNREAAMAKLEPAAAGGDGAARFAQGVIGFMGAIEGLAQGFYRHGFEIPAAGPGMGPAIGMPMLRNPEPEPLSYEAFRRILSDFVNRVDAAQPRLLEAGEAVEFVVPLDILQFRIDVDADGAVSANESLAGLLLGPLGPGGLAEPHMPAPSGEDNGMLPRLVIGFDRADAFWLAGYSNVLAAQADFLLAHDFETFFEVVFHRLFPRAGLPMQGFPGTGTLVMDPDTDAAIADLVAAIHTINWRIVEPQRLRRVHQRLTAVTQLSRRNWQAILAETDDNAELVPSPTQTSLVPEANVTAEMVEAWHATLDTIDSILAGELLVPHWRFTSGFDLRAWFQTAERTDLVLLLTGYDALPYLRDGPVASAESFAAANRVFGNDLLGYAFWFN